MYDGALNYANFHESTRCLHLISLLDGWRPTPFGEFRKESGNTRNVRLARVWRWAREYPLFAISADQSHQREAPRGGVEF